jgi:hypothetical protein
MVDSMFSFTDLPVNLLTWTGAGGIVLSVIISVLVLVSRLVGAIEQLGYTPLMLMLGFSTSLNLLSAGIVGGYVWRTYENTKRRPLGLVMHQQSFCPAPHPEPSDAVGLANLSGSEVPCQPVHLTGRRVL